LVGYVPFLVLQVTQTVSGVTLAVAQTMAFQSNFAYAVSNAAGLPVSAITVLNVAAPATGTGVTVSYSIYATNVVPAAVTAGVGNAAVVQAQLKTGYPSITVAAATVNNVTPTAEPTSTKAPQKGSPPSNYIYTGCFAPTEMVTLESGGQTRISDVKVGSFVLLVGAITIG
jgi:hypothetical protein